MSTTARVAVVWGAAYLVWRLGTLDGADPIAASLLLWAEVVGLAVFAGRVRSSRVTPARTAVTPGVPMPDTTAVVDATGCSLDELRTSLVSLRRVEGLPRVVVVDREGSRWLRTIAERFDATVADRDQSMEQVVRTCGTGWVLLLRAGDLPMPDLLSVAAAACSAPDVAVVQLGFEEADPTSFEDDPEGRWSLVPFEQEVLRPSLAASGEVPWYGDGPALLRRDALARIDPLPSGRLLDDSRRAGLRLRRAGLRLTHLPVALARVRGPVGLGDSLLRRHRRTARALRALTPGELRGVPRAAVATHLLALLPLAAAVHRVLLFAAAVVVLGLARVPMVISSLELVAFAAPAYALRWYSHLLLGRGRLRPAGLLRSELRSLGVDLLPFARLRSRRGRAGMFVLGVMVAVSFAVTVLAAVAAWREWPGRLPAGTAAVALGLTIAFLGVAMEVMLEALVRRQRRRGQRVRLGLVTCRLQEHDGQLVDLSTGGAGVVISGTADALTVGDATTIAFRIPDADGAWRSVTALVRIAHCSPDPDGGTHVGLTFDDPTDAPLDPVIEFLTIDRRLVALGRHERQHH